MEPTQGVAYALGVAGIQPLASATDGPAVDGADTRQMVDAYARMRDILLAVDADHPDLGIHAELGRLGTLIVDDKLGEFADGFHDLIEKAKPFFPKE